MTDEARFVVHVTVEEGDDPLADTIRREALAVLDALDLDAAPELSLLVVSDRRIRELNREWRKIDRSTDVLSFPQDPAAGLLGDVVVNLAAARRQAADHGLEPSEETRFLLIHGILHLLGWDHGTEEDRSRMEAEEQRLWEALGGAGTIR